MTDLDATIRERLDDPKGFLENGIEPLIRAITAVLDRHKRLELAPDGEICLECSGAQFGAEVRSPCPTVCDIAGALGLEVAGA